jgi:hypothetical protein
MIPPVNVCNARWNSELFKLVEDDNAIAAFRTQLPAFIVNSFTLDSQPGVAKISSVPISRSQVNRSCHLFRKNRNGGHPSNAQSYAPPRQ